MKEKALEDILSDLSSIKKVCTFRESTTEKDIEKEMWVDWAFIMDKTSELIKKQANEIKELRPKAWAWEEYMSGYNR